MSQETHAFSFTKENIKLISKILAKYPKDRQGSALLPLLDLAQRQLGGWISQAAMETIATLLKIPPMRVLEVASFYSMFNLKPVGKYHIQLCTTTPCWLRGSDAIKKTCEKELGITLNQTTPDGKFSLIETECLGACVNAPMMQINDDFYEDLTEETTKVILAHLKNDEPITPGSQQGRKSSESCPLKEVSQC